MEQSTAVQILAHLASASKSRQDELQVTLNQLSEQRPEDARVVHATLRAFARDHPCSDQQYVTWTGALTCPQSLSTFNPFGTDCTLLAHGLRALATVIAESTDALAAMRRLMQADYSVLLEPHGADFGMTYLRALATRQPALLKSLAFRTSTPLAAPAELASIVLKHPTIQARDALSCVSSIFLLASQPEQEDRSFNLEPAPAAEVDAAVPEYVTQAPGYCEGGSSFSSTDDEVGTLTWETLEELVDEIVYPPGQRDRSDQWLRQSEIVTSNMRQARSPDVDHGTDPIIVENAFRHIIGIRLNPTTLRAMFTASTRGMQN